MTKLNIELYDKFHEKSGIQKRIIGKNNFTYINVIRTLSNILPKNKHIDILDYGCGVGTLSLYMSQLGHRVKGVDISKKAISTANRSKNFLKIKNVNFFCINDKKIVSNFQLITCIEVIEHVPDPHALLIQLHSLLNKSGVIMVTTPSVDAPLFKLGLLKNFEIRVGHIRRYSQEALVKEIKSAGFNIVSIQKKEGILRNILFTSEKLSFFIKFLKGPLSIAATFVDDISANIFGASNYFIIANKP